MKVQVHAVQFTADQKLIDFIEKKIEKLNRFFDRIIHAEVYLSLDAGKGQVKNKVAKVKIGVPGNQIVVSESSKMFEESVDLAIQSAGRLLKRHKEKIRNK